jgi:hypothetical protein
MRVVIKAAQEAGLSARAEPDTHSPPGGILQT